MAVRTSLEPLITVTNQLQFRFIIYEGDDVDEADEILLGCGPSGTLDTEEDAE